MVTSSPRVIEGYRLYQTLGSGLQGKVKLAQHIESGRYVALKIIDKTKLGEREFKNLCKEIEAMKKVQHPSIIRLLAVHNNVMYPKKNGSTKEVVFIVLDLAQGGELFDFMMYTGRFSEPIARTFFKQLIDGLAACHAQKVYHRDIKPENLLLDHEFRLKIADFGLSSLHETSDGALSLLYTQCGTRGYMAPEILEGRPYSGSQVDIWSAGVVLFIMLAGFPPFQIAQRTDWWFRAVKLKKYEAFWAAHSRTATFSSDVMDLLNTIFVAEAGERATLDKIMQHPWLAGPTLPDEELRAELMGRKERVDAEKRKEELKKQAQQQAMAGNAGEFDPFDQVVMRSVTAPVYSDPANVHVPQLPEKECAGIARYTCFYTRQNPADVLGRLAQALSMMGASHKLNEEACKIKADIVSNGGKIRVQLQLFADPSDPELFVVQVCRRSGPCLKFQQVYNVLCSHVADVMCAAPGTKSIESDEIEFEPDLPEVATLI